MKQMFSILIASTFLPVVQVAVVVVLIGVIEGMTVEGSGLVVTAEPDDVVLVDVALGSDGDDGATARTRFDGRRGVFAFDAEGVVESFVLCRQNKVNTIILDLINQGQFDNINQMILKIYLIFTLFLFLDVEAVLETFVLCRQNKENTIILKIYLLFILFLFLDAECIVESFVLHISKK